MQRIGEVEEIANREYKNTVFTLLFGTREEAARIYNAIFGTNYSADDVVITTLVNVLYRGRINMVDGKLVVLIEHQSTINKNMAIRMLQYYAETSNLLTMFCAYNQRVYNGETMMTLYRLTDPDRKIVAGVLAGVADYYKWDVSILRLAAVALAVFSAFFPVAILYVAAALIVPVKENGSR